MHFKSSGYFSRIATKLFQRKRRELRKLIPSAQIEHIGSTAIPDAITKGDLDIQVRVLPDYFPKVKKQLEKLYEINQAENWSSTFASFKDEFSFEIPIGIQLTVINSEEDNLFRKQQALLLNNPDLLKKYNQMKLRFEGKSLKNYRTARAKFFDKLK